MKYLNERLKEPSTWRGLTLIATAFGVNVSPELQSAIVSTGLLIAGINYYIAVQGWILLVAMQFTRSIHNGI